MVRAAITKWPLMGRSLNGTYNSSPVRTQSIQKMTRVPCILIVIASGASTGECLISNDSLPFGGQVAVSLYFSPFFAYFSLLQFALSLHISSCLPTNRSTTDDASSDTERETERETDKGTIAIGEPSLQRTPERKGRAFRLILN